MKQLVCETWYSSTSVDIKLTYPSEHPAFIMKERQEKIVVKDGKKYVFYWIEVANEAPPVTELPVDHSQVKRKLNNQRKKDEKSKLVREKWERIERYRKSGGCNPTNKDFISAGKLQKIVNRQNKVNYLTD